MEADTKLTIVMWCQIFAENFTAPSSGHFRRRRYTRNLLATIIATAVLARPVIDLEKTLTRIHGGLHLQLRAFTKLTKKIL